MDNYSTLENPPIKEAIIDIRFNPKSLLTIQKLESIVEKSLPTYANIKPIIEHGVSIQINQANPADLENSTASNIVGFRLDNTQESYVVQYRINGFTLSKLPKYETFKQFKEEAQKLWAIFTSSIGEIKVERLALRFINEFEIPYTHGLVDFDKYLVNGPRVPNGLNAEVSSFFERIVLPSPDRTSSIIVTQAMKRPTISGIPIILDIDTFRENVGTFSEQEMWDFFDSLRRYKNVSFFGSLTEQTLELFT